MSSFSDDCSSLPTAHLIPEQDRIFEYKGESLMHFIQVRRVIGFAVLFAFAVAAFAATTPSTQADEGSHEPNVPSPVCDRINAPAGTILAFHAYALGVQIYRWNGTAWTFVEPVANLYASRNFMGQVGIHYAGPTWESNSGSKVVARRLEACTPDPNAIDYLLLEKVSTEGPGIFDGVTHIQRLNTVGGKAPTAPGTVVGTTVEIPYTAEYFFYRAQ
jgi:hypothetical protein